MAEWVALGEEDGNQCAYAMAVPGGMVFQPYTGESIIFIPGDPSEISKWIKENAVEAG